MIKVKLFGIAKEIVAAEHYEVEPGLSVLDLKNKLKMEFPAFSDLRSVMVAINDEYATEEKVISENDDVVIIPPVSGG